jgi:integrase
MLRDEVKKSRGDAWIDPRDRKVAIGELVKDLVTYYRGQGKETFAKDTESRWKLHLQSTFEHVPAPALSTSHLRKYKADRLAEKDKPARATVNRELQILRRAYKLAAKHEPPKVAKVPLFDLDREDNARKNFFTVDQVDVLRQAASKEGPEWRCLIEFANGLGWRRGELIGLRVSSFDMLAGTVHIETSKNGEGRTIPLTEHLKMFVRPLLIGRGADALVFPSITESSIRYGWQRICKAAGVQGIMHDWRRTSARTKRAAGVSESTIMKVQGWKTSDQFRRYDIVDLDDKLAALRKSEEYESQTRTPVVQESDSGEQKKEQVQ